MNFITHRFSFIAAWLGIIVAGMLSLPGVTYAQQAVSGKVLDAQSGDPLAGATVQLAETDQGTSTDKNGQFRLRIRSEKAVLQVRFIGYTSREIRVKAGQEGIVIALQPAELHLNQVVVQGYNRRTSLMKTPEAVAALSPRDFKRGDEMYLQNTLNRVAGVQMEMRSPTSQSHILIRGIGTKSRFHMYGIKTYLNGIPLTSADGTTSLDFVDFTSVNSTEVIKGPNSSLYGSNTGGVVKLYTKRGQYGEQGVTQSLKTGSFGLLRTNTSVEAGSDRSRIYLNYGYQELGGFRPHSSSNKQFVTMTGDFNPNARQNVSVTLLYTDANDKYAGELERSTFESSPDVANPGYIQKDIGSNYNQLLAGLTHNYEFASGLTNSTTIFGGHSFTKLPIEPFFSRTATTRMGARSAFGYITPAAGGKLDLQAGGEYMRDFSIERHYNISNTGQAGDINSDRELLSKAFSLFAQARLDLSSRTSVTVGSAVSGLNYDITDMYNMDAVDYSGSRSFDAVWSPRIAVLHQLNDKVSIYANVSSGYGPPSSSEISVRDGSINRSLAPETSVNYEVGSRGTVWSNKLNFEVSLFDLKLRDSFIPRQQNGFTYYENAGESENKGVEIALSWLLINKPGNVVNLLRPHLSYTYNQFRFNNFQSGSENYEGNDVPGVAPNMISAGVDLESLGGGYAFLNYHFVDERPLYDDNRSYTDAYSVVNIKVGWNRKVYAGWEADLHLGVSNLLDANYSPMVALNQRTFGPNDAPNIYNPAPGINWYGGASLSYRF